MGGVEELGVWKRSVDLSAEIHTDPKELRDDGFRDQITRAGLSIPSNIAEGMEHSTPADQCKFFDDERSSCGEVRTHVIVGSRVGFIKEPPSESWVQETSERSTMIQGLIRSIRGKNR